MDGAARTNAVAAGEYDLRDGGHQAGLSRGLVADEDEFRQRSVMVDTKRLERAQGVIETLQVLADVLQVLVDVACLGHVDIMVGDGLGVLLESPGPNLHEDDILSHLGVLLASVCGGHGSWVGVSSVRAAGGKRDSRAPDRWARLASGETIELEVAEGAGLFGMADRGVTAAGVLELDGRGGVAVRAGA